ncbi:MAG: hypothetical protein LAO18_01325 [Acidobacteriia bacterium]|nr:hypothetical protein [Terriglobia bacterium]
MSQEIKGTATVKVRNVTIRNVEVVKLANGDYDVPFKVTNLRFLDPG